MLSEIYKVTLNPSNIRYSDSNKWIGQIGAHRGFCKFSDQIYGVRALVVLLRNYIKKGVDTIPAIVSKFAPAIENDTKKYIAFVEDYLHFRGHFPERIEYDSIDFRLLCEAICKYETGYTLYVWEFNYVILRFGL